MKLWLANIEMETPVWAEDEGAAERAALHGFEDELSEARIYLTEVTDSKQLTGLSEAYPWGGEGDLTCGELWQRLWDEAAPEDHPGQAPLFTKEP